MKSAIGKRSAKGCDQDKGDAQISKIRLECRLRIDPIIDCEDFEVRYSNLIDDLFCGPYLKKRLHSVSMGAFRLPNLSLGKSKNFILTNPFLPGD